MCYLSQWVGLIHELAQGIRSKETVDYTTDGFSVNQICRCEHFVVTNIHAFANSTAHTGQTYCKLIAELLTYGTNASVTQMVNIIDIGFTVNQFNETLDNFNDVLTSQDAHSWINVHIQFTVDAVTTNMAQVIALVTKEEVEKLGVEKTAEGEDNIINTVTEVAFSEGDLVTITEGLMEGNSGVVESIDAANSTVRVIVSFMGKEAPVELPLSQVEKAID